jgi:hypothetical protein
MKKFAIILCVILVLCFTAAYAEEISGKTLLWDHTFTEEENDKTVEQTVQVSLTTKEPVKLAVMQTDVNDGFIGIVSRPGVAPISIDVYPADVQLHANLKNASEEQSQMLIQYMTEQYEEGQYTFDMITAADGNVYYTLITPNIVSTMTVIENVEIELIQAHFDEHFIPLTEEDKVFAQEILEGIEIK